jgi:hypothetical protein
LPQLCLARDSGKYLPFRSYYYAHRIVGNLDRWDEWEAGAGRAYHYVAAGVDIEPTVASVSCRFRVWINHSEEATAVNRYIELATSLSQSLSGNWCLLKYRYT